MTREFKEVGFSRLVEPRYSPALQKGGGKPPHSKAPPARGATMGRPRVQWSGAQHFSQGTIVGIFENNSGRKMLESQMKKEGRLPPGQSATLKWPVLHYAEVPKFNAPAWEFRTLGLVEMPLKLNWQEFMKLPRVKVTADFHCVTRWSRFDNRWEGVPFRAVCDLTRPKAEASHVLVHAAEGYTTNVPLRDLLEANVLFAMKHDGEPLTPEHGGPLRLIVPKLYAWKSAKWVMGLEFLVQDRLGFWEQNGYHRYGDPFKEQRHTED